MKQIDESVNQSRVVKDVLQDAQAFVRDMAQCQDGFHDPASEHSTCRQCRCQITRGSRERYPRVINAGRWSPLVIYRGPFAKLSA